ncbi:MAG: hypothetical protein V4621_02375 [Pseudomonadota bacterium]
MQVTTPTIQQNNARPLAAQTQKPAALPPVFRLESRLIDGEKRTAGTMPVWGAPQTIAEEIAATAQDKTTGGAAEFAHSLAPQTQIAPGDQPFGFGDLIDMINPLQHIPLLNMAYRHVTGDAIRPVGKIIGGTLFGGPLGGAVALVDTAIESGTGQDMAGLAMAPSSHTAKPAATDSLPGTTLALADLSHSDFHSFQLNA